jgi:hypothetical protein
MPSSSRRTLSSGVQRGGNGSGGGAPSNRRRRAAVDFESDFDDVAADDAAFLAGGDPGYSNKGDGPEWRDHYRQCFMNLPCRVFHLFVLLATLFLVTVGFVQPSSTQTAWYHLIEGAILLIFFTEVGSRLYIARSHFWASKINVVEAGICALCAITFAAMVVAHHGGSSEEHEIVMGLRYVAQLLRISVFYKSGWSAVAGAAGVAGGSSGGSAGSGNGDITLLAAGAPAVVTSTVSPRGHGPDGNGTGVVIADHTTAGPSGAR